MIRINGRRYGTALQIAAHLGPDVTTDMIRKWADPDREAKPLTAIRAGRNVYYPLDEATDIEATKHLSGRGRPRRLDEKIMAAASFVH
ncbi:hypothetical protein GA0070616_4377 [Micromonospora nigra]|uniref:Uncharacterized protein n=1 Tax=Micromonospora nigra TaxID=145857 RepID=A0A1C6SSA1_9ACTN|nr:hypothetical protein [Micromonospora nigra]SCL32035.1 hypothetical protein GA0070616_4377 [Micromonospora nigra]